MFARTESAVGSKEIAPLTCVNRALTRIRRAAQLIAAGTLNGAQSRQFATEIERIVDTLLRQPRPLPPRPDARLTRLSVRERQVLSALAAGNSVQEVAHLFSRSPKTINNQRTSVLRKLELRNTAELTRFAIRSGLVDLDGSGAPASAQIQDTQTKNPGP